MRLMLKMIARAPIRPINIEHIIYILLTIVSVAGFDKIVPLFENAAMLVKTISKKFHDGCVHNRPKIIKIIHEILNAMIAIALYTWSSMMWR